jgi:myo-inositol-1(or 4)-monophosphatase
MEDKRLLQALEAAKAAAQEAGIKLLPHFGNVEAESKDGGNGIEGVFTKLDIETEEFLHKRLDEFAEEIGLNIGFRGEGRGTQTEAEITWLVDPIDGTTSFIRGLPYCMVMISLIDHGEVALAIIHDIANEDTYWAVRGGGSYRNEERISVSERSLKKGLVCFEAKLEKSDNLDRFLRLRQQTVPMLGLNSGYEFIMIASGKLEGKVALDPYGKDWDFAPGSLLVREAGGVVRNVGSSEYNYRNHNFIIANPNVYRELTTGAEAVFPEK